MPRPPQKLRSYKSGIAREFVRGREEVLPSPVHIHHAAINYHNINNAIEAACSFLVEPLNILGHPFPSTNVNWDIFHWSQECNMSSLPKAVCIIRVPYQK